MWWRMFDPASATPQELSDDPGCIEGVKVEGAPATEKRSLAQSYSFDPSQECKLAAGKKTNVIFAHNLELKLNLLSLDLSNGKLALKASQRSLNEKCGGAFPKDGSLLPDEFVLPAGIPDALAEVAAGHLSKKLHPRWPRYWNARPRRSKCKKQVSPHRLPPFALPV